MKITPFAPALLVLGIAVGLSACGKKEEAPAPVVAPAPARCRNRAAAGSGC
ncbi:hypothetical protein [Dokdonella sp.]|uniref:hypothetical protein n=1 Tax=Dokdonella sp. TaxID=2291710 RepID=UPI003527F4D5